MKHIRKTAALGLLLLFTASAFAPAPGVDFVSKKGKFSIRFKATPQTSKMNVPTAVGNIKMYMFMHEESRTKAYMVAYCDYPKKFVKKADPVTLLTGSKEGVIEKFNATITREEVHEFMGYPCIDFAASGPQYHTEYKLVLAHNRLYQVGVLSEDDIKKADVEGFIKTFEILE